MFHCCASIIYVKWFANVLFVLLWQWTYVRCNFYRCTSLNNNEICNIYLLEELHHEDTIFIGGSDFQIINDLAEIGSQVCQDFIVTRFCFYEFPPCEFIIDNVSELLPICPQRCSEIQAFYEINDNIPFSVIENFNCLSPSTYYFSTTEQLHISDIRCSKFIR